MEPGPTSAGSLWYHPGLRQPHGPGGGWRGGQVAHQDSMLRLSNSTHQGVKKGLGCKGQKHSPTVSPHRWPNVSSCLTGPKRVLPATLKGRARSMARLALGSPVPPGHPARCCPIPQGGHRLPGRTCCGWCISGKWAQWPGCFCYGADTGVRQTRGCSIRVTPGCVLTPLLVLQEEEQGGEEGPPQAEPEEEDGEWDTAPRPHIAAPHWPRRRDCAEVPWDTPAKDLSGRTRGVHGVGEDRGRVARVHSL